MSDETRVRQLRLVAGTINRIPDNEDWRNVHVDATDRPIWDPELSMGVNPEHVASLEDGLPMFRDGQFDSVQCWHVLEHLTPGAAGLALKAFARVLKKHGTLDVETPDVERVCAAYTNGELDLPGVSQWLLGEQLAAHAAPDSHRSCWTEASLRDALTRVGFQVDDREPTGLAVRFVAVRK